MNTPLVATLQELIRTGEKLIPQGGSEFSGYNAKRQSKYLLWRKKSLDAIGVLREKGTVLFSRIANDENGMYFYQSSAQKITSVITEALEIAMDSAEPAVVDAQPAPEKHVAIADTADSLQGPREGDGAVNGDGGVETAVAETPPFDSISDAIILDPVLAEAIDDTTDEHGSHDAHAAIDTIGADTAAPEGQNSAAPPADEAALVQSDTDLAAAIVGNPAPDTDEMQARSDENEAAVAAVDRETPDGAAPHASSAIESASTDAEIHAAITFAVDAMEAQSHEIEPSLLPAEAPATTETAITAPADATEANDVEQAATETPVIIFSSAAHPSLEQLRKFFSTIGIDTVLLTHAERHWNSFAPLHDMRPLPRFAAFLLSEEYRDEELLMLGFLAGKYQWLSVCCIHHNTITVPELPPGMSHKEFVNALDEIHSGVVKELTTAGYSASL